MHDHPAVVLDLSANGIGIIRSLHRRGIQVYAFDTEAKYQIGKTRYAICSSCPSPLTEEIQLLMFLLQLAKTLPRKAVLYVGSDDFLFFISKHRTLLADHYLFLLPAHELIEGVLDKTQAYTIACTRQVASPKTLVVEHEDELAALLPELTFPCLLKPAVSHEFRRRMGKKAIRVETAEELVEVYHYYRQFGELMIQEYISGGEDQIYQVGTFFDREMNLLGLFMGQKLHQFPPQFGTGALVVSKRDEEVLEAGVSFLRSLNFVGLAVVEFKRDPRDGTLKFIEINARTWLWHSLSGRCGVDLSYLYYLSLTGQNPTPQLEQREGPRWIYLVRHFLSFMQRWRAGEMSWGEWWRSLRGEKEYALFTWDDPLPFVRSFISHLRNNWRMVRKK